MSSNKACCGSEETKAAELRQIPAALERLYNSQSRLSKTVEVLSVRVSSVINQSITTAPISLKKEAVEQDNMAPVASQINEYAREVNTACNRLDIILNQLEL